MNLTKELIPVKSQDKRTEELKSSLINEIIKQEPPTIDILRQKKPERIRYSNIIKTRNTRY
jgi:ferritin-like protein